jgi:hypothetical protein
MPAKERNQIVRQFASIQKRAAVLISGAFRTTAAEALNIELYLTPMKHQIGQVVCEAAIRVRTGPVHVIPRSAVIPRTREEIKHGGRTPIEAQMVKKDGGLVTTQGQDMPLDDTAGLPASPMAGGTRCGHQE